MALSLLTMTTDNLQHVENHMLLLGRKTSQERVAAFLLEMNGRLTAAGVMALPMCRRDIADYLGITIETVSRALSEFHRKGYLRFLPNRRTECRWPDRIRPLILQLGAARADRLETRLGAFNHQGFTWRNG